MGSPRQYRLYLESGPRHRPTMVHVLDLLGCMAQGSTTEEALAATPQAIESYLAFLRRHGEHVSEGSSPISVVVTEHIKTGFFVGRGSPSIIFQPELTSIGAEEMGRYLRWLGWAREELLELAKGCGEEGLDAPTPGARTIREILEHVWQAEQWYIKSLGPRPPARRCPDVFGKMEAVREVTRQRLGGLTEEERGAVFHAPGPFSPSGNDPWTARKAIRRCLEHQWEHLLEVGRRLGRTS